MKFEDPRCFDILLVEDEAADANLVRSALKLNKALCHLHHVLDGVDALAFLRRTLPLHQTAPRPDLILLDWNLPRMNGRELLQEIKQDPELRSIPVVVLTTSDAERDMLASYQLGAAGFVTKPADMAQFIHTVAQLNEYWFEAVSLPENP